MKTMMIAIAGSVLAFQGAVAQETETSGQEAGEGIPATVHQEEAAREIPSDRFEQLDEDGSGSLSRQEAQAEATLSDRWGELDQDGDGNLSPEEFTGFEGGTAAGEEVAQEGEPGEGIPATRHQEQAVEGDLVGQLDEDGDGLVSQEEAQVEAQLSENWDRYDENADGVLDSRELDRFEQDILETEEAE